MRTPLTIAMFGNMGLAGPGDVPTRRIRERSSLPTEVRDLFAAIEKHDPRSAIWCVGENITFCVIPRGQVDPALHRIIENEALREEARRLITKYDWPLSNVEGADAVLILAPAQ